MMAQIIEAAQSLEPGKPTLHQSYNNPAGTGRAEGDPNVYKGDQINFYVDDGGPYRLEADMLAGHVEIELMPSSYVIEYGNGDTDTNYTAGKPVTTYPRERPRETATSYAYQRSGNFHAYATVHYTARFRVDSGPWQMMEVTPQATSDPCWCVCGGLMWAAWQVTAATTTLAGAARMTPRWVRRIIRTRACVRPISVPVSAGI